MARAVYHKAPVAKAAVGGAGLLCYYLMAVRSGASPWTLFIVSICAVGYILLPGLLAARLLPQKAYPKALFWPVAILCGMLFIAAVYLVAIRLWRPFLLWGPLPVAAFALYWELRARRRAATGAGGAAEAQQAPAGPAHRLPPEIGNLAGLFGIVLVVAAFAGPVMNLLPTGEGGSLVHQDLLWNAGNAASLKISFPPWDARFLGTPLRYHFFNDILVASLSIVTGVGCYEVAVFCTLPLMLAGTFVSLYGLGQVFFKGSRPRSFAFLLLIFGTASASLWWPLQHQSHPFGNSFLVHLLTNINMQTSTTVLIGVFLGLWVDAMERRFKAGFWQTALILASFFLLCVIKGPEAAILMAAAAVAALVLFLAKRCGWQGLAVAGGLVALFGGAYLVLFAGGAALSVTLDPVGTLLHGAFGGVVRSLQQSAPAALWVAVPLLWLAQALLVLPLPMFLTVLSFIGVAKTARGKRFREELFGAQPRQLLCWIGAGGAMVAFFLFNHMAYLQAYFLFVAVFFLCLVAVQQLPLVFPRLCAIARPLEDDEVTHKAAAKPWPKAVRAIALLLALVQGFTAACLYAGFVWQGAQHLADPEADGAAVGLITKADVNAAAWVRNNTHPETIIATNRLSSGHIRPGDSYVYSGLCERRAWVEGFYFVATSNGIEWQVLEDHLTVNEALFSEETPLDEVITLARERKIGYLIYHGPSEGSDAHLQGLEKVFGEGDVAVYKIPQLAG